MRNKVLTFKLSIVLLAISSGLGLFYVGAQASHPTSQNNKSANQNASRRAIPVKALFTKNCVTCHGSNGRGETVPGTIAGSPNFTEAKWQESVSDQRMIISVTHGRGGMPSFKDKLKPDEITSLVAYVRKFKR